MRAMLVGDETYANPPRCDAGVLVKRHGLIHVVRSNRGVHVKLFCDEDWKAYSTLERDWYDIPTCVRCAVNPRAILDRYRELKWRWEWHERVP